MSFVLRSAAFGLGVYFVGNLSLVISKFHHVSSVNPSATVISQAVSISLDASL